jgi:DNA-binding transcriptional MerR regulator
VGERVDQSVHSRRTLDPSGGTVEATGDRRLQRVSAEQVTALDQDRGRAGHAHRRRLHRIVDDPFDDDRVKFGNVKRIPQPGQRQRAVRAAGNGEHLDPHHRYRKPARVQEGQEAVLIGELAAATGVPAKTIRYYETIGVLDPPQRTASGYRTFDSVAADRLGFIRAAQSCGLTLGEIRSVVALRDRGVTPCGHVLKLLNARAADVDRRIAELRRLRAELRRLVEHGRHLDPADCDPRRVCHILGPDN